MLLFFKMFCIFAADNGSQVYDVGNLEVETFKIVKI